MVVFAPARPREAFVLGAGFSRAISQAMPLTDELGRRLEAEAPEIFGSIGSKSFESWLSQRAEPQPYLAVAGNLQRQAVFAGATGMIARVLDWAIAEALTAPLPRWLGELVSLWHHRQSDVLTFNYDPLVECAFATLQFWDWRRDAHFQWGSLLNYNPHGMAGSSLGEIDGSQPPHPSFRLWKLHGSTNWFWSPGDTTGASALRVSLPGAFGAPTRLDEDDQHWKAPGRERLIVPPSALKSPYYANPLTRETWARGFEALAAAEIVTLVGYSLPLTDLTTVGMLSEAMETGLVREVRVVDFSPEPIVERLRVLAPDHVDIVAFGSGEGAVSDYVNRMLDAAAQSAVAAIRARQGDVADWHMTVTWGDLPHGPYDRVEDWGRTAAVIGMEPMDAERRLTLNAAELTSFDGAVNLRPDGRSPHLPLSEVLARLGEVDTLEVRIQGLAAPVTVVASAARRTDHGAGAGDWLQLVPAGLLARG